MKILSGVLIEDEEGRILCGVRNAPDKPFNGLLAVPWREADIGEDPFETAHRACWCELDDQEPDIQPISACTEDSPIANEYRLFLFRANQLPYRPFAIDLSSRGQTEMSQLEWLTPAQIRSRGMVVPALLTILDHFYPQ